MLRTLPLEISLAEGTMRLGIVVALLTLACATGSSGNSADSKSSDRHSRDLITAEELASSKARNVYDAIRELRPSFLQAHRTASTSPVTARVYVDGTPLGEGLEILRQMRPDDVTEIRYLSGPDATQRFGTGNAAGAILVKTKH
jgi:hypothetical protein